MGICRRCGYGITDSEEEAGVCPNCFYGIYVDDSYDKYDKKMEGHKLSCELLCTSAELGILENIKQCLANGADVNAKNKYGRTALSLASGSGYFEIVKILVENSADVNARRDGGWTALMFALENGHFEIVKYLVVNGADADDELKIACSKWILAIAQYQIKSGADINYMLYNASSNGHLEVVKYLIENGADVNVKNNDNKTALDLAKTDKIKAYLEQSIKQKELQDNFIDFTIQGDIEKIRECLASGININMADSDGKTALNYSAESGNVELMKLLLAQGADTGAKK